MPATAWPGRWCRPVFGNVRNLEIVPLLFEITGSFVHEPNPLVERTWTMLKAKMAEAKPDLGVCFDGDADRACFWTKPARRSAAT